MIEQASLFENNSENGRPLASRVRPQTLEQFVGQENLLGPGKVLRELIEKDRSDQFDDFLGSARCWQNHIGRNHCSQKQSKIHYLQRSYEWNQRNSQDRS